MTATSILMVTTNIAHKKTARRRFFQAELQAGLAYLTANHAAQSRTAQS